jgi:hypothetical protein
MIWKRRNHLGRHRKDKSRGGAGAILALGALALGGCAVAPPAGPESSTVYPAYASYPAYYYPYYPYYGSSFFGAGFGFHHRFHRHRFPHHHFSHSQFHHAHH